MVKFLPNRPVIAPPNSLVTPAGIYSDLSAFNPPKAFIPIFFTVSGITMSVIASDSPNASTPISVTV